MIWTASNGLRSVPWLEHRCCAAAWTGTQLHAVWDPAGACASRAVSVHGLACRGCGCAAGVDARGGAVCGCGGGGVVVIIAVATGAGKRF